MEWFFGNILNNMKIAIDASQIIYGTGVSVYTNKLISNLLKVDSSNEYVLFGGSLRRFGELKSSLNGFSGKYTTKVFPYPPSLANVIWNKLHLLPVEKIIGDVDVFHSSDWTQPPSSAFKVATVHDLIPLKFARYIHPKIVGVHKDRLNWVKKEVDRIIVPSSSAKEDLIEFGVDANKIRVIYESNNISKATPDRVEEIKRKYKISGDYILTIGSAFYKNSENVVKAFDLSSTGQDIKLVIIGRQTNTKISERRNIRVTGFVTDEDYAAICTGAKAFVFPSLYEGFGIAILDAFACGTPVVTSNVSSMPEVAGNAAILVDPYEVDSIAEGIARALRGPKALIEKGYERVKQFSWEETAKKTLAVYNESK